MLSLALNVIRIVIFGGILFVFYVLNNLTALPTPADLESVLRTAQLSSS
jgi:hypothetical protein